MKLWTKHRDLIIFAALILIYVSLNFATTHVEPQGSGGLSGPCQVRVYASEYHLAIFYPVYLVERFIRNGDIFYASYYYNCDFKDHQYVHDWMYGDGKYSQLCGGYPLYIIAFWSVMAAISVAVKRVAHFPLLASLVVGSACAMLVAFGFFSYITMRMEDWEVREAKSGHFLPSVLWFSASDSNGIVTKAWSSPLRASVRPGLFASNEMSVKLLNATSNGFRMEISKWKGESKISMLIVDFPYEAITKTNWNNLQIAGEFPWHKAGTWTNKPPDFPTWF